jgi:hypothetical protein
MHESRSEAPAQMDLEGVAPAPAQGVGARRPGRPRRRRGGGYLNERISSDVWEVAKLHELEVMGLPGVWLEVAAVIGYDDFMAMWAILDRSIQLRSESESMIDVKLRRLASFRRFQRNRFIESLVKAGLDDKAIQAMVHAQLGESLSLSHIFRLADRRRVRVA